MVFGLVAIFFIGVGVGLSQKSYYLGNLADQPVFSEHPVAASDVLEVKNVSVDPEKFTLTYTITKESQVSVWLENDEGRVVRLVRPATLLSSGVFTDTVSGGVYEPSRYYFVLAAVDPLTDEIVTVKEPFELSVQE